MDCGLLELLVVIGARLEGAVTGGAMGRGMEVIAVVGGEVVTAEDVI